MNNLSALIKFFLHISDIFKRDDIDTDKFILLGDFNTCMSNKYDIVSGKKHPETVVTKLNSVVTGLSLSDAYRVKFPFTKIYTWSRKKINKPRVSRRLDYIFVSESIVPFIKKVDIRDFAVLQLRIHADFVM